MKMNQKNFNFPKTFNFRFSVIFRSKISFALLRSKYLWLLNKSLKLSIMLCKSSDHNNYSIAFPVGQIRILCNIIYVAASSIAQSTLVLFHVLPRYLWRTRTWTNREHACQLNSAEGQDKTNAELVGINF